MPSKQWAGGSNPSRHANFFLEFKKSLVCVDNYRHHMVGIVQLVRASALNVVGSNPTTHPILILIYRDIAKSVRHQILILACVGSSPAIPARAISSVGRALDF